MQRYFFHFVSTGEKVPDERGVALPDLSRAHAHAMRLVSELVPVLSEADRRRWRIDITGPSGGNAVTVLFPVSVLPLRAADAAAAGAPRHIVHPQHGKRIAVFGLRT